MLTPTELDEAMDNREAYCRAMMAQDGEVQGLIAGTSPLQKAHIIAPLFFENHDEKVDLLNRVKKVFREKEVDEYFCIMEAWSLKAVEGEDMSQWFGRLEQHPNRIEVVTIMYVSYKVVRTRAFEIIREGDSQPTLKRLDGDDSTVDLTNPEATYGGYFAELLPRYYGPTDTTEILAKKLAKGLVDGVMPKEVLL